MATVEVGEFGTPLKRIASRCARSPPSSYLSCSLYRVPLLPHSAASRGCTHSRNTPHVGSSSSWPMVEGQSRDEILELRRFRSLTNLSPLTFIARYKHALRTNEDNGCRATIPQLHDRSPVKQHCTVLCNPSRVERVVGLMKP